MLNKDTLIILPTIGSSHSGPAYKAKSNPKARELKSLSSLISK